MGIKQFYGFIKNYNEECIMKEIPLVQNVAVDFNACLHPSAQRVYEYGNGKPTHPPLIKRPSFGKKKEKTFKDVAIDACSELVRFVNTMKPTKRLIICTDSVCGLSKSNQQRQRRARSSVENQGPFDTSNISVGTVFMDEITKEVNAFIIKQKQSEWSHLEIIFSDQTVPGEGEAKGFQFFRKLCKGESNIMVSLDADCIIYGLLLDAPTTYIFREHLGRMSIINVGRLNELIKEELKTPSAIYDFAVLLKFIGNDFCPQIPSLEILRGGITTLLFIYKEFCPNGLVDVENNFTIRIPEMVNIVRQLGFLEEDALKKKFQQRHNYFPDPLMEGFFQVDPSEQIDGKEKIIVEFDAYKKAYYKKKLNIETPEEIKRVCFEYLRMMQWNIRYYADKIPCWDMCYNYSYAPFLSDLAKCGDMDFTITEGSKTPYEPFLQLLTILPHKSHNLLPKPFDTLAYEILPEMYPDDFVIDPSGKKQLWEAIVMLEMCDMEKMTSFYEQHKHLISEKDMQRNIRGKTRIYR